MHKKTFSTSKLDGSISQLTYCQTNSLAANKRRPPNSEFHFSIQFVYHGLEAVCSILWKWHETRQFCWCILSHNAKNSSFIIRCPPHTALDYHDRSTKYSLTCWLESFHPKLLIIFKTWADFHNKQQKLNGLITSLRLIHISQGILLFPQSEPSVKLHTASLSSFVHSYYFL